MSVRIGVGAPPAASDALPVSNTDDFGTDASTLSDAPGADIVTIVGNGTIVDSVPVVKIGIVVTVENKSVVDELVVTFAEAMELRMLDASSGEIVVVSGARVIVVADPSEMGTGMNCVMVWVAAGASVTEGVGGDEDCGNEDCVNVVEKRSFVVDMTLGGLVEISVGLGSVELEEGRASVSPLRPCPSSSPGEVMLLPSGLPILAGGGVMAPASPSLNGLSTPACWKTATASRWLAHVTTLTTESH